MDIIRSDHFGIVPPLEGRCRTGPGSPVATLPPMSDRGATLVESVIAVTVLGVGGLAAVGSWHTLTVSSTVAQQRSLAAVSLVEAHAELTTTCTAGVTTYAAVTVLDPCPGSGPARVRLDTGSGRSHRHLTVIVDGGP